MKLIATLAAVGLAAALSACGQGGGTDKAEPAAPAAAAPEARTVRGSGVVTAVDAAGGTVTIDHAPIPEAGWPAMTMAFKAPPQLLQEVKAGDKVAFDLKLDGAGEITAIRRQ